MRWVSPPVGREGIPLIFYVRRAGNATLNLSDALACLPAEAEGFHMSFHKTGSGIRIDSLSWGMELPSLHELRTEAGALILQTASLSEIEQALVDLPPGGYALLLRRPGGAQRKGKDSPSPEPVSFPLRVYPNPTKGSVTIEAPEGQLPLKVQIYDASGRQLLERLLSKGQETLALPVESGLYILQVEKGKTTKRLLLLRE
ncbi:MAG: T9SS type A sorting domain-containing protein [Bacteroidia bacterium]|nr:T9SS type A sorting domain-containing protein [Bacteroidia bacterium]